MKTKTPPKKRCTECGETTFHGGRKTKTWRFEGRKFEVSMPALICTRCGTARFAIQAIEAAEKLIASNLAKFGPVTGETFAFMRKVLRVKSGELAEWLQVAPETVSRWENGKRDIDRPAWITVGTMMLEATKSSSGVPDLRSRFAALERVPKKKTELKV